MACKKTTVTDSTVKPVTKTAAVKAEKTTTEKTTATADKTVKATAEKKEAAPKKAAAKKTTTAAKKETAPKKAAAPKKTAAKKTTTAKKATEEAIKLVIEVGGQQISEADIIAKVKADMKEKGAKAAAMKAIDIYAQPENNVVYYVSNAGTAKELKGEVSFF